MAKSKPPSKSSASAKSATNPTNASSSSVQQDIHELQQKTWVGKHWEMQQSRWFEQVRTEDGNELISAEQRNILKMARRYARLPTLNIRHMQREQAIVYVEQFIREQRSQNKRFVRIIPGKGISSSDGPVLKPAVIEWCIHEGSEHIVNWAPEMDGGADYGTIVVQLRSPLRTKKHFSEQ